MAMQSYTGNNQQDNKPTVNVYTPISFSNPDSQIQPSRFSISYFNRLMMMSIALKLKGNDNDEYAKYSDNPTKVFISYRQAKILHDAILKMRTDNTIHNVCVETKNGLLKVSDGSEYGSPTACISISYASDQNAIVEVVYQTKNTDTVAYNYSDGEYSTMDMPNFEIDTLVMILDQYYYASSYAVAATVRESSMYYNKGIRDTIRAIAVKVGVNFEGATKSQQNYNNHTFLSGSNNSNNKPQFNNGATNNTPKGYDQASFDDIVNAMSGYTNSNDEDDDD